MTGRSYTLVNLYDADLRTRDAGARELASKVTIPHPLYEVRYADGVLRDTTAGRVRMLPWLKGRRVEGGAS